MGRSWGGRRIPPALVRKDAANLPYTYIRHREGAFYAGSPKYFAEIFDRPAEIPGEDLCPGNRPRAFSWLGEYRGIYMEMKMEKKCCLLVATKRQPKLNHP
jgi:hypothetical protein